MSPSSAGSKRSSEKSDRRTRIVASLRAVADSRPLEAFREALKVSFWSFGLAIVVFTIVQPAGSFPVRIAGAVVPSLGCMAAVLVAVLAWYLARACALDRYALVAGSSLAFALALPRHAPPGAIGFFRALGGSGIFLAVVIAFAVAGSAVAIGRLRFAPRVAAWAGAAAVVGTFALLRLAGISVGELLVAALQPLATLGDSYPALLMVVAVETLLWTIGIHGPALLAAIITPVYLGLQGQNSDAFAHGRPLEHIVTTSTFHFVFPGGAGATLPLVLLMLRSRIGRVRKLAAATVVPSLFGINEPLLFGLPMILEPAFALPFVGVPLVLATTTYGAMAAGWVARPAYYVPSVIPPFLNGFLSTTDWRACVLTAFNLVVAAAIYLPFLRMYERNHEVKE